MFSLKTCNNDYMNIRHLNSMLHRCGRREDCNRSGLRMFFTTAMVLSVLILLLCASEGSDADTGGSCGTDATWSYKNGTLTISGIGAMDDYSAESDTTPWSGYRDSIAAIFVSNGITSVGNYAFHDYTTVYSVTLPDSLTAIGTSAFAYCTGLTELTLPINLDPVSSNDSPAFEGCTNIQTVGFSRGTGISHDYTETEMGTFCIKTPWYFSRSKLTSVNFADDITHIGSYIFFGCDRLGSIIIPDSVTSIGRGAFSGCSGLNTLTLPASVDSVGANDSPAFKDCCSISNITFTKGTGEWFQYDIGAVGLETHVHFTPWYYSKYTLDTVTIESGVTNIGDFAFQGCTSLESVTLPNSITVIGVSTFDGCTSLSVFNIPDGTAAIGESAFRNCTGLRGLSLPINLNAVSSNAYPAFEGCSYIEHMTFTMGTGIWHTYNQSSSLSEKDCYLYTPWYLSRETVTEVTLGYGVTTVTDWQFNGFSALSTVDLPESISFLGRNAFSECPRLTTIQFPN